MLYFYYGDDIYGLEQKLALFRERYAAKFSSGLNFWKLDLTEDLERLRDVVETHSMFEEKKLVLASGASELAAEQWEGVEAVIKKNDLRKSEDVVVVFYEKKSAKEIDKRKKAFGYLKREAKLEEFKAPTGAKLLSWIGGEVKKRGGSISGEATRELAERVGPDTLRIVREIEKLVLYSSGRTIERADVARLVSRTANPNIFETLDALARRDVAAALGAFREHIEKGDDPVQLLGMFAYELRTLLLVKEASAEHRDSAAVARSLKIHPFVAQKNLGLTRGLTMGELKKAHCRLAEADLAIKTGKKEPALALEDFIYSFGQP